MYRYERVLTNHQSNIEHSILLADVFEKPHLFTPKFIDWQYAQNPSGEIVGFNAMYKSLIAAHYVAQPFYAKINGNVHKGLLSLNTATHHEHRGKGLFTQLAEQTYAAAANEGFAFVIGVANQNSVHGFINKLGFQKVGQLKAKIGLGGVPKKDLLRQVQYERIWDAESLKWRLNNPCNNYLAHTNDEVIVYSKTHLPFIKAEMIKAHVSAVIEKPDPIGFSPLTLYIGTDASINFKGNLFFDIPDRFRPSPLYLIFKDLTGNNLQLSFEDLRFQLIDFDAY
jgi:GNAT superfamily N-acetyltransferase